MRIVSSCLTRLTAVSLVMLLATPFADAAPQQQQTSGGDQSQSVTARTNQPEVPESKTAEPESGTSLAEPVSPGNPAHVPSQAQSQPVPAASEPQESTPPRPVGTAAAPYEKTTGVAASRPAGAVIAPAKQKRARIILIRVAIVVGAAVAVGTVVALSKASPSRPN